MLHLEPSQLETSASESPVVLECLSVTVCRVTVVCGQVGNLPPHSHSLPAACPGVTSPLLLCRPLPQLESDQTREPGLGTDAMSIFTAPVSVPAIATCSVQDQGHQGQGGPGLPTSTSGNKAQI